MKLYNAYNTWKKGSCGYEITCKNITATIVMNCRTAEKRAIAKDRDDFRYPIKAKLEEAA